MGQHDEKAQSGRLPPKLAPGITALLEAFDYAQDVDCDAWEFAVSIRELQSLGIVASDLRWLVRKGFIEHASEVTVLGDNGRQFRPTGDLTFCDSTCVILTPAGVAANSDGQNRNLTANSCHTNYSKNGHGLSSSLPIWDCDARKLFFRSVLVKWFKWRAANQEVVLSAFQEEGWPSRIDDPLCPRPDQDPKRRLSDTIKCLNQKQTNEVIRFHGDGSGEGIVWEAHEIAG